MSANLMVGVPAFAESGEEAGTQGGTGGATVIPQSTGVSYEGGYSVTDPSTDEVVNYILLEVDDSDYDDVVYKLDDTELEPSEVLTDSGQATFVKLEVPAALAGQTVTLTTTGADSDLSESVSIPADGVGAPTVLYGEKRMDFSEFFYDITEDVTEVHPTTTSFATDGTVATPTLFIAQGTRSGNNYPDGISWATSSAYPAVDTISSATFGDAVHFMPSKGLELNYSGADINTQGEGHAATGILAVQVGVDFDLYANASLLEQASEGTAQTAAVAAIVEASDAEAITWIDETDVYKAKYLFVDGSWGARDATALNDVYDDHPVPSEPSTSYGTTWTTRQFTVNFNLSASGLTTEGCWDNYLDYAYGGYVENKSTGERQPLVWLQNLFSHRMHTNFDVSLNDSLFARLALDYPDNYKIVLYADGFEDFVVDDIHLKDVANVSATIEQGTTFYVDPTDQDTWFEGGELHIQQVSNPAAAATTARLYKGAIEVESNLYAFSEDSGEVTLAFDDDFFLDEFQGAYTIRFVADSDDVASLPLSFTVNKLVDWPTLSVEDGATGVADANVQATPLAVPQNKSVSLSNASLARTLLTSGRGSVSSVADLTTPEAVVVVTNVLKRASSNDPYTIDASTLVVGHTYRITLATTNYAVETAPDTYSTSLVYYLTVEEPLSGPDVDGEVVYITSLLPGDRAIDIYGNSRVAGAQAIVWPNHGLVNQRFVLESDGDGFYLIRSVSSGMVLDIEGGTPSLWAHIVQNVQSDADSQLWKIVNEGGGAFSLHPKGNNALSIYVPGTVGATNALVLHLSSGHDSQLFAFTPVRVAGLDDGVYNLTSVRSGLNLDIFGAASSERAAAIVWNGHNRANQRFIFTYEPSTGFYTIQAAHSGLYLDVEANGVAGARIIQYHATGGLNQRWIIEEDGQGSYTIRSASRGLALDVMGNSTAQGTSVIAWTSHGRVNQLWSIDAA
jgi:hypothetical protein